MDGYLLASRIGSAWLRGTNTHPWFRFSNAQFLLEDVDSVKSKLSWIPQLLKVPMQQMPAWISCFQSIPRTGYSVQLIVWGFFGLVPTPTPVLVCIRKKKVNLGFPKQKCKSCVSLALFLDHQLPSVAIFSLVFQVLYTQPSVWLSWWSLKYLGKDSISSLTVS